MTIMDRAVLQLPMVVMVFSTTAGSCHWVSIRIRPTKQAMMQGWVATFFSVPFQSVLWV